MTCKKNEELREALKAYQKMYEEIQPAGGWQGVYEMGVLALKEEPDEADYQVVKAQGSWVQEQGMFASGWCLRLVHSYGTTKGKSTTVASFFYNGCMSKSDPRGRYQVDVRLPNFALREDLLHHHSQEEAKAIAEKAVVAWFQRFNIKLELEILEEGQVTENASARNN